MVGEKVAEAEAVPTPVRSLTQSSLNSSSSNGLAITEQAEKLKDVSLRIRGTMRMDVRGRRKRTHHDPDLDANDSQKRPRLCEQPAGTGEAMSLAKEEASGSQATQAGHIPARDEEVARWLSVAPSSAFASFGGSLEAMCRRMAALPANQLRVVLQKFAYRRAWGDPDSTTLAWMEAFVVAILAYDYGVHIRMPARVKRGSDTTTCISNDAAQPDVWAGSGEKGVISDTHHQIVRISAGRAAAAAGIHPYTDVGELFLELVYQDLPELLLRDAALAGVEVISAAGEREHLLEKSGRAQLLQTILRDASLVQSVAEARAAREAVDRAVDAAKVDGKLSDGEAADLKNTLQLEINLDFGTRHEDAALEAYEVKIGVRTYGQQHRIKVAMPRAGPGEALLRFPVPGSGCKSTIEAAAAANAAATAAVADASGPAVSGAATNVETQGCTKGHADEDAYFYITGFTDAIVDIPKGPASPAGDSLGTETLVVEVKHRMGKIQEPPNIYDVVQLSTYCHVLGCSRGHLVQCLRSHDARGSPGSNQHELHVTLLDFSPGSPDRRGFDEHVLPALYGMAEAVYAVRGDEGKRIELLKAADPAARTALTRQLCPHLDR